MMGPRVQTESQDARMADKSPRRSNDKKRGRSLNEKRAAKREKRAQRADDARARDRIEGA
jgi:hypothetical protein